MGKNKKLQKAKASVATVPQTYAQVVTAIAELGQAQRAKTRIETEMNDALAAVKEQHELLAEPYNASIKDLSAGIQIWCEANRHTLTNGGKVKTANFASGEVRWRLAPSSVALKKVEAVIALLKEKGLQKFIRTKEEVNKDAILLAPKEVAGIPGITINQAEEFVIVPYEAKLDEVA
jgi:phage host-nuclease inhibitor protein Gam